MKKRKFAEGGSTVAGPSSGIGSPSMIGKRPTSADALRYLRATGNKAGADEILKAAVGKPAKMPEDYGSVFSKKAGPQTPAGVVKPASSGIVSSSREALASMPERSFVPTIPGDAPRTSDADIRAFETMARSTPQPGPRAPVSAPAAPVDRGPPMVAPGPRNLNPDDSPIGVRPDNTPRPMGFVEEAPPQPSMGPAPTMRTPVRPTSPAQMMKKGGQVKPKAYASGGTVRGSGIAQRGVKKCKIY